MKIVGFNFSSQFANQQINPKSGPSGVRDFLLATGCKEDETTIYWSAHHEGFSFGSEARANSVYNFSVEFLVTTSGKKTRFFQIKDTDGNVTIEGAALYDTHLYPLDEEGAAFMLVSFIPKDSEKKMTEAMKMFVEE